MIFPSLPYLQNGTRIENTNLNSQSQKLHLKFNVEAPEDVPDIKNLQTA